MRYLSAGLIFILLTCCTQPSSNDADLENKWSVTMADAVMQRFDSLYHYNNPGRINWQYDIAMLGQSIDKLGYLDAKYSRYHEDFIDHFITEDGRIVTFDIERPFVPKSCVQGLCVAAEKNRSWPPGSCTVPGTSPSRARLR